MRQEIANPTKGMVALEQRLGRPVEEIVRERYVEQGQSMAEVALFLGIDISTLSRWMVRFGIPARIFASERPERVA
jgi:transposase